MPLLVAAALMLLAFVNLRVLAAATGGAGSTLLSVPPTALLQQGAGPLMLGLAILVVMMQQGKWLVDKPQLMPELPMPWH